MDNHSLSGHPIKLCKDKWQLTYKRLSHSNLFFMRLIIRRKMTQNIMNIPKYIYSLLKQLVGSSFHLS